MSQTAKVIDQLLILPYPPGLAAPPISMCEGAGQPDHLLLLLLLLLLFLLYHLFMHVVLLLLDQVYCAQDVSTQVHAVKKVRKCT